jgi:hypothetical protein
MQIKFIPLTPGKSPSPLRKLVALILTIAMLGLVLMFSAVLLVIIAIIGTLGWAYLWWKTRELRKRMRNFVPRDVAQEHKASNDDVIEGEVIRVVDPGKEK